jgi:hypothetical protein
MSSTKAGHGRRTAGRYRTSAGRDRKFPGTLPIDGREAGGARRPPVLGAVYDAEAGSCSPTWFAGVAST